MSEQLDPFTFWLVVAHERVARYRHRAIWYRSKIHTLAVPPYDWKDGKRGSSKLRKELEWCEREMKLCLKGLYEAGYPRQKK